VNTLEWFVMLLVIASAKRYLNLGKWVWWAAGACVVLDFLWGLHLAYERVKGRG